MISFIVSVNNSESDSIGTPLSVTVIVIGKVPESVKLGSTWSVASRSEVDGMNVANDGTPISVNVNVSPRSKSDALINTVSDCPSATD